MKINIDVRSPLGDQIIAASLKDAYETFTSIDCAVPMFSSDPEEEKREMKKLKKSFKKVYWYFTGETLK